MCGILYSVDGNKISDLEALQRRGPDGFNEQHNDLGYFAHSLLNTMGDSVAQPYATKKGILLYNGSTYNSRGLNDTKWLGDQLDGNLQNTVELIRSLRGEYALIYVTEDHIVFCTDEFYQRNLWFYFSGAERQITVSTIQKTVRDKHHAAWYCEENKIYIVDRKTFRIETVQNRFWNFDQKIGNYDTVIEKFEQAVKVRHDPAITTNLQSAGFDSGVINCACINLFDSHKAIIDVAKESKEIIAQRLKKHKFTVVKYGTEQKEKIDIFQKTYNSHEVFMHTETDPLINLFRHIKEKHKNKVVITGNGGDEIYADRSGENDSLIKGRLNGAFPENLELIWPWHNQPNDRMYTGNQRFDYIAGWFGLEVRNPFLDQDLVQSWLNTTCKLKNSGHKEWIENYMKNYEYPYTTEKFHFNQPATQDSIG